MDIKLNSKYIIAGGLAGTAVDTVLFPLDTIKTRLQSSSGFTASGGWNGIFRGLKPAIVGSAPGSALFFITYEKCKDHFSKINSISNSSFNHMLSASLGEMVACIVRVPTELVKQRLQASHYSYASDCIRDILRSQGWKGFYQGYATTVLREIPFTCIQFPLYEILKKRVKDLHPEKSPETYQYAVCGSIAGGIAAGLTTPLDVAKTRIMLSRSINPQLGMLSTYGTIHHIAKKEGVSVLFSGITPRVCWISLGGFIFFGVYEKVKSLL